MLMWVVFAAAIVVVFKVSEIEDRSPAVWIASLIVLSFLLPFMIPSMLISIGLSLGLILVAMTTLKVIQR